MKHAHELRSISDDELLRRLSELVRQSRRVDAELIAHIGEVDHRRLYAREACSSMFSYATGVMHFSEPEAYLRIAVARACRKFPVPLEMLADGRLHLSGIDKLAPHLTEENCEMLLARATHKSKREVEELVSDLSPRPDTPASIRKLPTPSPKVSPPTEAAELGPGPVVSPAVPVAVPPREPVQPVLPAPPARTGVVEPLGCARYRIQFTASASLRDKLERLKVLLRSSVPDGDLATIIEEAVTEKLERLEAKRWAETKTQRKTVGESNTSPGSRYIPAAVKRTVRARDADQCTFVDGEGRRCTERRGLEFHHDHPFALGGDRRPENIRLACKTHNVYLAELDYGKAAMARHRRDDDRVSEPAPFYGTHQPTGRFRESTGYLLDCHRYQWKRG